MSWIGKAVGGTIGFMIGGPLGAIAGAALGHGFDTTAGHKEIKLNCPNCGASLVIPSPGEYQCPDCNHTFVYGDDGYKQDVYSTDQLHMTFYITTFSLLAKLARADGFVSREEINAIENFIQNKLQLDNQARKIAIDVFRTAKNSPNTFEDFAKQFYHVFRDEPEILLSMIEILLEVAYADGTFHPNEERLINSAVYIFHIRSDDYEWLKAKYDRDIDKYLAILGCSRTDSNEVIKKKYRKLITEYHPDKIISKGLPEEFTNYAKKKFIEIQEAYEKVMAERKKSVSHNA